MLSSISHLSECMLYLHCFHLFLRRQNTCFRDIVFKTFSPVPNHFKSRHNTCFSYIAFIYFSVVRMHALLTLLSSISQSSECVLYLHCFHLFLRRQNTCFRDIVFKTFSAVPNCFKCRHSAYFRNIVYIFSPKFPFFFQIPSDCVL